MGTRHREAENTSLKIWRLVIDKTFLTSLAASLHAAGLQDEQHNLVSQPSLDPGELHWVEGREMCNCPLLGQRLFTKNGTAGKRL